MKEILTLPSEPEKMFFEYMHLRLGGKEVVCPYFMNIQKERAGLTVLIGKGTPGEIEKEVNVWAKLKGVDLYKSSEKQIRDFMMSRDIGIDCSGFVANILNYWIKSQNKGIKRLKDYLLFENNTLYAKAIRTLRPIERISANLLTNSDNAEIIKDINEIKPGDLIRAKGKQKNSHHVMLIRSVLREDGIVKQIEYIHSHRHYEDQNGVRIGNIIVKNPRLELKDQEWTEVLNGRNWTLEDLLVDYEDNGLRRLRNLKFLRHVSTRLQN